MTAAIELKARGRLVDTTLSQLGNVSIDPADVRSLANDWCLHPHAPDRELSEAEPADVQRVFSPVYNVEECCCIQEMHRRYLEYREAVGRGSWPPGNECHPDKYPHKGYHATTIFIDESFLRNSSLNREPTDAEWQLHLVDAKVWPSVDNPVKSVADAKKLFSYDSQDIRVRAFDRPEWAQRSDRKAGQPYTVFDLSSWLYLEAARRAGLFHVEVFIGSANVHERMISMSSNLGGYAYFNDGSCRDRVTSNIQINRTYSLGGITGLRGHENAHTLNGEHQFKSPQCPSDGGHGSILSYCQELNRYPYQGFRETGPPYLFVEDHSWPVWRKHFGGEYALPIIVEPPPPPTPPEIPGELYGEIFGNQQIAIRGEITAYERQYVVAPKTGSPGVYVVIPKPIL